MAAEMQRTLTDWQQETVLELLRIPSVDSEGQQEIIRYIRNRIERKGITLHELETGGCPTLVAELGCPIEQARCSVLLHSHIDTVYGTETEERNQSSTLFPSRKDRGKWTDPWPDRYTPRIEGDDLLGSGAYDMKAGVMLAMDIGRYFPPPPGMHVDIAFLPDEERCSGGQQRLAEWILEQRRGYHVCLSPEVEPRTAVDRDMRQRIVVGRRGALKVGGDIRITEGAQGHSAVGSPNAIRCLGQLDRFLSSTEHMREHVILGREEAIDTAVSADGREEASPPSRGEFAYTVLLVPGKEDPEAPFGVAGAINQEILRQRRLLQRTFTAIGWQRNQVQLRLWKDDEHTSYLPFFTDPSHPVIERTKSVAREVAHPDNDPLIVGGSSNADSNLFHGFFREHYGDLGLREPTVVFDLPYRGSGAHSMYERASISSVATVRDILWRLLGDAFPAHFCAKE
ncbi:MAG: M20/M25/M40 family metallo-hydrolase [Candidatus Peribacteraceae bacterium]|nr:M20/M25/M40 family metallo-hydrolase [Candidatus Peribacteraceae bacterium]